MSYREEIAKENEMIRERYQLISERIAGIMEETGEQRRIRDREQYYYFITTAAFLNSIIQTVELVEGGEYEALPMEAVSQLNQGLYSYIRDRIPENDMGVDGMCYRTSYADPAYAVSRLGERYGTILSFLFTELMGLIPCAYEDRLFDLTITMELFIEIYNYFEEEDGTTYDSVKSAIYYHFKDYSADTIAKRTREMLDPAMSFAAEIIMESDLNDLRYLYRFGEYISGNELKTAQFLNSLSEDTLESMARTFTEGYRNGFINNHIDLSRKSVVNIRYTIGFERIVREAVRQFEAMGLKVTIYRAAVSSIHKRQHLKIGYCSTGPSRQYDYDHRFDEALYLNKSFVERKLASLRSAYEQYKDLADRYAGPAVMEIFGEHTFVPEEKKECLKLSEKQQELSVYYHREASLITNEFVKSEETSFTIIAYPVPSIGSRFEEIFRETVKVNTLDMNLYRVIQQRMIDALDQGQYVRVKGKNGNRTDIRVMLHELTDPDRETNFENCLADVNIPLGEVFTSPRLAGTEGVLHVKEVYLNDLRYQDLELGFRDGMIISYTCGNYSKEEDNCRFVKENLMYQRDTLPIGEFAIGTNTAAYRMGKQFGISHKLPILIAEKTGPHFAVGDTCYKMSEDNRVCNPDGKEITAKDNECSILRKTDMTRAYFNCHTDITIPYDELGEITVYQKDGSSTAILKDGRFVLPGTMELNRALDEMGIREEN